MGCECITSCFIFSWSPVFRFSIDDLQNVTILLFTSTASIEFSTQLCGTLSSAFWQSIRAILKLFILFQYSYIAFDITNWSLHPLLAGLYPYYCYYIIIIIIIINGWDIVVTTLTTLRDSNPGRDKRFSPKTYRQSLGPAKHAVKYVREFFPSGKGQGREADCAPHLGSRLKIIGTVSSLSVHAFMTCTGTFYLVQNNQLDAPNIQNSLVSWNSTCFGHILCPSSGVIYCTLGNWYVSCRLCARFRWGSGHITCIKRTNCQVYSR